MFQTIDTAEPNFPVNLFTPEEDTLRNRQLWLAFAIPLL